MKGQAAIEYLAIIGFVLLFATPILVQSQTAASDLRFAADTVSARNALTTTAEAARFVFSQGEPARVTFAITVPRGVRHTNVSGNALHVKMDEAHGNDDLYTFLEFNVTGSIPAEQGRYQMVAEAVSDTNVSISPK